MRKSTNIAAVASLTMLVLNVILVLLSWILSAMGVAGVRSLISSEGLRWFMGHYIDIIATPVLAWMLLLSIAYSSLCGSGLLHAVSKTLRREKPEFKQRLAMRATIAVLVVIVSVTSLLLLTPHAVLLSPVGDIFPSPFSRGIIPQVAGTVTLLSLTYGLVSGTINSLIAAFNTLYCKITSLFPLFLLYIFAAQLYASLLFVFGAQM